ncbi:MAG: type II toxin-antitoxin system prevent-host-death family antitoxin [Verrucomicrobia bacterium]|nr:type II toxin-antitoxin system prevent-host-death family antitoxin [Verrucomicrobiota bacterium]
MKKSKRVLGQRALLTPDAATVEEAATLRRRAEVSVREAKDQLSALLQRAAAGEEIVVTSDGEPKAMLVRFRPVVGGKPWQSLAAFRATMPMTPDSTPLIREMRDSGY